MTDAGTPLSGSASAPVDGFGAMTDEIAAMSSDAAGGFPDRACVIGVPPSNFAGASNEAPALFDGEDLRTAVLRLRAAGMAYSLIASALGVSKGQVAGIIYRTQKPDAMADYRARNPGKGRDKKPRAPRPGLARPYVPRGGAAPVDVGQKFGWLTVTGDAGHDAYNYRLLATVCGCGAARVVRRAVLSAGRATSCGCKASLTRVAARRGLTSSASVEPDFDAWDIPHAAPPPAVAKPYVERATRAARSLRGAAEIEVARARAAQAPKAAPRARGQTTVIRKPVPGQVFAAVEQAPVERITLDAPVLGACCWPMWQHGIRPSYGEHRFCDAPRYAAHHRYCEGHAERAFVRGEGVTA